MAIYKLIVLGNPIEGQDSQSNDWYTNQHLQDVGSVPGYRSTKRFKRAHPVGFRPCSPVVETCAK